MEPDFEPAPCQMCYTVAHEILTQCSAGSYFWCWFIPLLHSYASSYKAHADLVNTSTSASITYTVKKDLAVNLQEVHTSLLGALVSVCQDVTT